MRTNISERMQKYRNNLRAAVPNTGRSGFADECRRQSLSLLGDAQEADTLEWLELVADTDGWN